MLRGVRSLLAVAVVTFIAAPAFADRSMTFELGLTGDVRATGASFSTAGASDDLSKLGGMQLVLGFENAPLAIPAPGEISAELRLVPELLAGFLADDTHAEGMVGGGLRGELQLASNRRMPMSVAMYLAARAVVIGEHQDGAVQLVLGEYLSLSRGHRFGWEGGVMIRPRGGDVPTDQSRRARHDAHDLFRLALIGDSRVRRSRKRRTRKRGRRDRAAFRRSRKRRTRKRGRRDRAASGGAASGGRESEVMMMIRSAR